MVPVIRSAKPGDAGAILGIYAPYISETYVSFETEVPTTADFTVRMTGIMKSYPFLVCEEDGGIIGYAYGSGHRERAAYKYSADTSIYVAPGYQGRGAGRALYGRLLDLLRGQGIYTVFAGIVLPNEKSVGFHKALGFTEVGVYHNAGYKLGKWRDILWVEKPLREYDTPADARVGVPAGAPANARAYTVAAGSRPEV
jgi:phosphinothricin acetyltransferase